MDEEEEDDKVFIEHSRCHGDQLPSGIYRIHLSPTGEIVSRYTDPEDDETYCLNYPSLHDASLPGGTQIVRRDELEELERFGPKVDLVAYPPCAGTSAKKVRPRWRTLTVSSSDSTLTFEQVVVKYYVISASAPMFWKEMNMWMRLPSHPNIVPFDRVVVDELEGPVIGFTSHYVPGGNLEENKSRVSKLKWLQQLIKVMDSLNLEYGIAHQDIATRNLLVDESTDSIMLFDFNRAARSIFPSLEDRLLRVELNDIKGVVFTMYEIITRGYGLWTNHREPNADCLGTE
jgi:serine/threonine protein kinase